MKNLNYTDAVKFIVESIANGTEESITLPNSVVVKGYIKTIEHQMKYEYSILSAAQSLIVTCKTEDIDYTCQEWTETGCILWNKNISSAFISLDDLEAEVVMKPVIEEEPEMNLENVTYSSTDQNYQNEQVTIWFDVDSTQYGVVERLYEDNLIVDHEGHTVETELCHADEYLNGLKLLVTDEMRTA